MSDLSGVEITDAYMNEMNSRSQAYTLLLLCRTAKMAEPGAFPVVWEHGRRNHQLRIQGVMPIVCPTPDDAEMAGIGIFDATCEDVDQIMAEDPAVKSGLMTYTLHACRGFPGDALRG